ncbi:MAG: hypothetical protein RBU37_17560 [Myxococcota bacterium]|jgi:hypothetical protein|nr:hypothetical protein [Myxococcota bacterium]
MDSTERQKRNYLRIESSKFSLELEGDPAFILETYDNVREDVLRRLIELISSADRELRSSSVQNKAVRGQSLEELSTRAEESSPAVAPVRAANYLWVYITHEIYNKVYAVDLATFSASPLSRYFDGRRLRKLYLDKEYHGVLGSLVGTGKTLWSELTSKGRDKLNTPGNS